jgi:hypothetical protein
MSAASLDGGAAVAPAGPALCTDASAASGSCSTLSLFHSSILYGRTCLVNHTLRALQMHVQHLRASFLPHKVDGELLLREQPHIVCYVRFSSP